jgi:hypothetical protein
VTSANAPDVAATAYTTVTSVGSNASSSVGLVGATSVGASGTAADNGLVAVTLQQITRVLEQKAAGGTGFGAMSTATQSVSCSTSGSISYTLTRAADGIVSNGDSVTITANNCVEGSARYSGSFSAQFANLSGTPSATGAWSATLQMSYSAFGIALTDASGTASLTYNGGVSIAVNQVSASNASYTISGSSFGFVFVYQGKTLTQILRNFNLTGSNVSGTYTSSADFALSGSSPTLGTMSYTVKTNLPFKRTGTYPSQGSITVTAGNGSSVKLTAIDSTYVQLQVDKNGDGVYEESNTMTWVALSSR